MIRALEPTVLLLAATACSGGSSTPTSVVAVPSAPRSSDPLDAGGGDALAEALWAAGGGTVAWAGRPAGNPAPQFADDILAHATDHAWGTALGGGAGPSLLGSTRNRRLALDPGAPGDLNGNGTNLDETLAAEDELLANAAGSAALLGTAPITFGWSTVTARAAAPLEGAGRLSFDRQRTVAAPGPITMAGVGEGMLARATLAVALLEQDRGGLLGADPLSGQLGLHLMQQALAMEETLVQRLFHDGTGLGPIPDPENYDPTAETTRWLPARFVGVDDPNLAGVPSAWLPADRASSLTGLAAVLRACAELAWIADDNNPNPNLHDLFRGHPFAAIVQGGGGGQTPVNFVEHIQPLLTAKCAGCHTFVPGTNNFNVLSYQAVLQGGLHAQQGFPTVVPFDHTASNLWRVLEGQSPITSPMPFNQPSLPQGDIDLVAQWIDEGAIEDPPVPKAPPGPGRTLGRILVRNIRALHMNQDGGLHHRYEGDEASGLATAAASGRALAALAAFSAALPNDQEVRDVLVDAASFAVLWHVAGNGRAQDRDLGDLATFENAELDGQAAMAWGLLAAGRVLGDQAVLATGMGALTHLLDEFTLAGTPLFVIRPGNFAARLAPGTLALVLRALEEGMSNTQLEARSTAARNDLILALRRVLVPAEWDGRGEVLGDGIADTDGNGIPEPVAADGGAGALPLLGRAVVYGPDSGLPTDNRITWSRHLHPLLRIKCGGCHMDGALKGDYRLDSPTLAATPGDSGGFMDLVAPGDPEGSLLYRKVADRLPPIGVQMPQAQPPLDERGIETVRLWIVQGATRR